MYDILKLKTYQKPLLTITTIVTYGVVLSTYIGESFRVLQNELCYNVTRLLFSPVTTSLWRRQRDGSFKSILAVVFRHCSQIFKIIWFYNLLALSVPDEHYSRIASGALNLISAFVLWWLLFFRVLIQICFKFTKKF